MVLGLNFGFAMSRTAWIVLICAYITIASLALTEHEPAQTGAGVQAGQGEHGNSQGQQGADGVSPPSAAWS